MSVVHQLVGYDRQTDRRRQNFEIPEDRLSEVKQIARVPRDDPDAVWSYPLSLAQAREIAGLIGGSVDPGAEFFLEAFSDSIARNAP